MESRKAISYTIKNRKANRVGHTLSWNCLQKHVTEEKTERMIEVTVRRRRRCKQLLDDLRETRELWKVEQELRTCG
jgi:queuine/archaeosine tRNA-ribosyltransferase